MIATFDNWTQNRLLPTMGTNAGAPVLAFQKWRHFKEAFAPELVARALTESAVPVARCLDPFGGSGTTALACQFLGVHPVTVEINPYLADLIEAKLTSYNADDVARDLGRVLRSAVRRKPVPALMARSAPPTLVEPGASGRWVFDANIAQRLGALIASIDELENTSHRRLFRVLLGGILVDVSNVVVNGKGRRYRRRWQERRRDASKVEQLFADSVRAAIIDIHRFRRRACLDFDVVRGDARSLKDQKTYELAVFSPPYPNSFDYTDVYNLELWILGYLNDGEHNRQLRESTLCSHVQIDRDYGSAPGNSPTLDGVMAHLEERKATLWHRRLPSMVGGYFRDIVTVLSAVKGVLDESGAIWLVVGDSRYAEVLIPTGRIVKELASQAGLEVIGSEPFRSMRSSAQQGGSRQLEETLVVLKPLAGSRC